MGAVGVRVAQCEQKLGCGFPLHRYSVDNSRGAVWMNQSVPLPRLSHSSRTLVKELGRTSTSGGGVNLTLEVQGPGQVVILASPGPSFQLSSWQLTSTPMPRGSWKGRPAYNMQVGWKPNQETIACLCAVCEGPWSQAYAILALSGAQE